MLTHSARTKQSSSRSGEDLWQWAQREEKPTLPEIEQGSPLAGWVRALLWLRGIRKPGKIRHHRSGTF